MFIVHLITGLERGGAEGQLRNLILRCDRSRFQHAVISIQRGGAIEAELKTAGVEVFSLGMRRPAPSLPALLRLVRLLQHLKPTIMHCWLYHGCLAGAIASRFVDIPQMIWGLRSASPGMRDYKLLTRVIGRLCARLSLLADSIVVNSQACWNVHRQLGYETNRMQLIYNGVDVGRFYPDASARESVRVELGLPGNSILVGLFAGYRPVKDHNTFIQACKLVHQRFPNVRFVLAGMGIDASNDALVNLVCTNDLKDAVHLLGVRVDMPRITAALDIACLSSRNEAFPNVILEAMACEVPCLVTDVGELRSMVGETGRVVPASHPVELAEAMTELLSLTSEKRARLGRQARERILAQFSLQKMVNAYQRLYEESRPDAFAEIQPAAPAASFFPAKDSKEN